MDTDGEGGKAGRGPGTNWLILEDRRESGSVRLLFTLREGAEAGDSQRTDQSVSELYFCSQLILLQITLHSTWVSAGPAGPGL